MIQTLAETDRFRAGILPPEDWEPRRGEMFHYPHWPPSPENSIVVVVEEKATGQIVASWIAANICMLEGLYITEEQRSQFTHVGGLLRDGMYSALRSLGVTGALTLAQDPAILALARKGGFEPIPGTLLKRGFDPEPPQR